MPLGGSGNGMRDGDTRTQEGDRGLIQNVRPASAEITGQQRELYAFDAFAYSTPEIKIGGEVTTQYLVGLKSPWQFDFGGITQEELKESVNDKVDSSEVGGILDTAEATSKTNLATILGYEDPDGILDPVEYMTQRAITEGATVIEGGFIRTSLIKVDDIIATNSIIVSSDIGALAALDTVEAGNLGSTIITGGKIRTDILDVTDIFAQDITATGTITGATITGGAISGGTISGATITAGSSINIGSGSFSVDSDGNVTATSLQAQGIVGDADSEKGAWLESGELLLTGPGSYIGIPGSPPPTAPTTLGKITSTSLGPQIQFSNWISFRSLASPDLRMFLSDLDFRLYTTARFDSPTIRMTSLPTSAPAISGRLWRDGTTVRIVP